MVHKEWLVTDRRGLFAMGTANGVHTRKYHSFLAGIAGRLERNFISRLDLNCSGVELWNHESLTEFNTQPWPAWYWNLEAGCFKAELVPLLRGGMELKLIWQSRRKTPIPLIVRPLWAMRPLHDLGASAVQTRPEGPIVHFQATKGESDVWIECDHRFNWHEYEAWIRNIHYSEEEARGYPANEDLYCAGQFELTLEHDSSASFYFNTRPRLQHTRLTRLPQPAQVLEDFVLHEPEGVVAGFPWFGEWGRDTFISLPGIVAGAFHDDPGIVSWAIEVLERWSKWIETDDMIPNLIAREGPQWESADGTLWWTHSLAALWSMSAAKPELGLLELLPQRFSKRLDHAVHAIAANRHQHLRQEPNGLLAVTSPHSTWMDARVNNEPVTPRMGILPEINALWIQARCIAALWKKKKDPELVNLARDLLVSDLEPERCNFVFLHSIPFAPSFIGHESVSMRRDAKRLVARFLTPVGLRTLDPAAPAYRDCYAGGAVERDLCYHQGPAWGWLKGHAEMALGRLERLGIGSWPIPAATTVRLSSIEGHFAEVFDARAPWTPRGAPAQAWSLACETEAKARMKWDVDTIVNKLLEGHI